ncbi:adenylyltransferase/cytidyltransferase family protein [bacterium]|jgi:rfaE bifunctional protein kinase chain/domain|nr:adenylyltransferase/cytidyltransferase family protein [bacterium]
MNIDSNVSKIQNLISINKRVVCVFGNFNILHPGHLRMLKFAKENGDFLVVGIRDKDKETALIDAKTRLESVRHSMYVDYAFINKSKEIDIVKQLRPDVVVKGSEHENKFNPEKETITSYGGKLIFSSGDMKFSSLSILKSEFENLNTSNIHKPFGYIKRNNIQTNKIRKILNNFSTLNVLVIGDTIIDEYKICEPLGMSQEDPTIVVSPISSNVFLGGAGIVAAHASGLGARVDFITVLGEDENTKVAQEKFDEYNVNAFIYKDSTRPTTLKQRFRANGKTLLRVNNFKKHHISREIQDKIFFDLEKNIKQKNLIVFSDFSYGCLPKELIDKITQLALKNNIMIAADSQSSSQTGDISKFHNATLATPTEREARLAIGDFESGLVVLAEKLKNKSNIDNIFITLGSEGMLIYATNKNNKSTWLTDQMPTLNSSPKDVSGAGDSLLISSSMAIALGSNVFESAYIGSLSASIQVGRVGNIPLNIEEIIDRINFDETNTLIDTV